MVVSKKQFVLGVYTERLADCSCLIFSAQGAVTLPSFAKGRSLTRLKVKLGNLVVEPALSLAGLTYCLSLNSSFDEALRDFVLFCVSLKRHSGEHSSASPFFLSTVKLGRLLVCNFLFNDFVNYVDMFSPVDVDLTVIRSSITLMFFGMYFIYFVSFLLRPFLVFFRSLTADR